ncbi:MAG: siderophore biosynthesis protein SbnG [Salinarimonadaceae bacterium]|nr:MAG: siderophore biosynthesis protein SbnG [Salinarimonadaceae bacterium]
MITRNALKRKFAAGSPCVAAMLTAPSTALAELLASGGADAVVIEAEHSTINEAQIEDLCRAIEVGGATPLCRVASADPHLILRVLDAGVMGVIVPHVRNAATAAAVVDAARYPPIGSRGSGTCRANGYGAMARGDYVALANEEVLVIAMIEDPEAVDDIEAILDVAGIDAIFIGAGDLSLSMGTTAKDPQVEASVARVASAASARRIPYIVAATEAEAPAWLKRGAAMVTIQILQSLRRSWTASVASLREIDANKEN